MHGTLFIISAPSGAGKTTLVNVVVKRLKKTDRIDRVITYTTKVPRPGEKDGHDYHFIDEATFKRRINQNFFLEWSTAYNAYYGCPKHILQDIATGHSFLLVIDRVGAQQVIKQIGRAVLIWIYTTNIEVLRSRLAHRGGEQQEEIQRRIEQAEYELKQEKSSSLYHYHILNDDFDQAARQFEQIVKNELLKRGAV